MSDENDTPFEPYDCSLGTVIDHTTDEHGSGYLIQQPDGQTVGVLANGEPSADNVEGDIAEPRLPTPAPITSLTPLQILSRMTQEEEAALNGSTDVAVQIVRNRLAAASEVRADDPRTAEGAAILVAKGILTAERADEIFPV
jgi:hypothetical protein